MSPLVKTNRQANFKDFKRFGAFKGLVEQKNVVFNSSHSRFKLAHSCQKNPIYTRKNSSNKLLFPAWLRPCQQSVKKMRKKWQLMSYNMMIGYDIYDRFTMEHFLLCQSMILTTSFFCSRQYICSALPTAFFFH
jgi:hypothetical protein